MKIIKILLLVITCLQLLSCESAKKGLGFEKNAPNEFLVEKRNSIVLPPNYDLLPPDSTNVKKNKIDEKDLSVLLNKEINKNNESKIDDEITKDSKQIKNTENQIINLIK